MSKSALAILALVIGGIPLAASFFGTSATGYVSACAYAGEPAPYLCSEQFAQLLEAWSSYAGLWATLVGIYFIYRTLALTREATVSAQKSVEAAERSVESADKGVMAANAATAASVDTMRAIMQSERANLSVRTTSLTFRWEGAAPNMVPSYGANLRVETHGKTPALITRVECYAPRAGAEEQCTIDSELAALRQILVEAFSLTVTAGAHNLFQIASEDTEDVRETYAAFHAFPSPILYVISFRDVFGVENQFRAIFDRRNAVVPEWIATAQRNQVIPTTRTGADASV